MASYALVRSAIFLLVASMYFSPSSGVSKMFWPPFVVKHRTKKPEKTLQSDLRTISADPPLLSLISLELTMKWVDMNFDDFSQFRDNTNYKLSQQKKYDSIADLGQLTTLAYNCENGISSSSSSSAGITEDMLLIAQTAVYTNAYAACS
ncbi:hypothetical protein Q3G72_003528 [Acer saccharum]|nr:hypothetical protein Q3G72_003528 [Acer saccharum]